MKNYCRKCGSKLLVQKDVPARDAIAGTRIWFSRLDPIYYMSEAVGKEKGWHNPKTGKFTPNTYTVYKCPNLLIKRRFSLIFLGMVNYIDDHDYFSSPSAIGRNLANAFS